MINVRTMAAPMTMAAAAAWTALRGHRSKAVPVCTLERDEKGLSVAIFY
jgi:hypothetical protein